MEKTSNYYFYVVECCDQTWYAGYTNDLQRRMKVHNDGKGAKYTRNRLPIHCIYYEQFETKSEALKAEYAFKRLNRQQKERYIAQNKRKEAPDEISKKLSDA